MKTQQRALIILLAAFGFSIFSPTNAQVIPISSEELNLIKQKEGVFLEGEDYNIIIRGHGTGLRPLTDAQWEEMRAKINVIKTYEGVVAAPPSTDNSSLPWFPPVGNQASEGSCVAWATGYYTKTFQEALEHGWDLSAATWTAGAPSVGYQDNIFSPDFIYHQINGGVDGGATYNDALHLLENVGCCSWLRMPYSYVDHTSWPDLDAWREAPLYRSATGYAWMFTTTDPELENLKEMLADNNLAIISINAYEYDNLSMEDLWTANAYNSTSTNHANTIVGYDDNYGPYIEDGVARYGAFKVVNSWGVGGWENVPDGFYYISYECMKEDIEYVMYYQNLLNYEPTMLAVYNIDHPFRDDCRVSFGIGETGSPYEVKYLNDEQYYKGGDHPFPSNDMALDISEFQPYFTGVSDILFEDVYDFGSTGGQLNSFSVEIYDDYISGIPLETLSAPGLPISTQQGADVYAIIGDVGVPDITVTPTFLDETLAPDELSTQPLTIGNTGDGPLDWVLDIMYTGGIEQKYDPEDLNPALIPGPEGLKSDASLASGQPEHKLTLDVDQPVIEKDGADPASVLYLNTNDGLDPLFTGLVSGLPNVATFDVIDGMVETPNTDYLLMYDVVMVSSNAEWADAITVGDNLASYSDLGGNVLTLNGVTCSGGSWTLGGAITGPDYLPIAITDFTALPDNTCTSFIGHPITEHVSTITSSIWAHSVLQGAGISLGSYAIDDYPVGAYNPNRPIVSLNVFPIDGFWEGDLIQMIYNTINWFGGGSGWLSCSPITGSIAAGSSSVIDANFDATGLADGIYEAYINVVSNDPDESLVPVPVTLTVDGGVPCEPGWTVVYYTNSTTAYGIVTIDDLGTPASSGDLVGAFVDGECRGIGEVVIDGGIAYTTLVIQGEVVEQAEFRIWDASACATIFEAYCADTDPGGILGYPPDFLPIGTGEGCVVEQILTLDQHWNLISLYAHPDDMSPESIFAPMSCLLQVKSMTESYDPSLPDFLNTLEFLTDGSGYFVNSSCPEEVSIIGQPVDGTETPIILVPGWNLIGYPFETPGAPEVAYLGLIN
ncbi:MAG: C1 family peptidase, partial [Bacteroidota bacterium]